MNLMGKSLPTERHSKLYGIPNRTSNTGSLSTVTSGFTNLATALEYIFSENFKLEDTEAVFRQVVALGFYRILSRLRSQHATSRKTAGKPALTTQLYEAIHNPSVRDGHLKESITDLAAEILKAQSIIARDREASLRILRCYEPYRSSSALDTPTISERAPNGSS